jgi:hypothetical protein
MYNIHHQEHANELNALSRPYPIEMAIKNNDIVVNQSDPYNNERFFEFLSNTEKGIPDKIRITKYGIDNPEISIRTILEYNGIYYIFTVAGDTTSPISYYGKELTLRRRSPDNPWQYFLKTYEGNEELIFTFYNFHETN